MISKAFSEAFSRRFKSTYIERRLRFPIEMSVKLGSWEIGGITDGKKNIQMFELGTRPDEVEIMLPLKMQGIDANGKRFEMELIG